MMQQLDAASKLSRARAGLVLDNPFYAALVMRLAVEADPTCETMWTDGKRLGYNPAFVDAISLDELKGSLGHEAMHVGCAHHARRQERAQRRWNIATDLAINDHLIAAGFRLPAGALTGGGVADCAETHYNRLPQDPPPQEQEDDDPGDGAGSSSPDGDQDEDQDGDAQPDDGQPSSQQKPDEHGDPGGCGEVRDATAPDGSPASQSDLDQAEADAKVALTEAVAAARAWGKLPAGLTRMIDEVLTPYVDWREVMRRFVAQAARDDYSWRRPNPRYLASGLYLPALRSEQLPPLAVAIDTSGSISPTVLSRFAGELAAIMQEARADATVVYCDATIQGVEEYGPDDALTLSPKGGGGTDFCPPFVEVGRRGLAPSCLIYLTDGECRSFPPEPEYPVLWALVGGMRPADFAPPFGEAIEVREQ